MRKNNRGITLINGILFILIIVCSVFIISIVMAPNDISYENTTQGQVKRNEISRRNTTEAKNEYTNYNITIGEPEPNFKNEAKDYYYKQLNSTGQSIYDIIVKNEALLKEGTNSIKIDIDSSDVGEYFQSAWDAFILDRPDIFWVDTLKMSLVTKTISNIFGTITYEYILEPGENNNYFLDSFKTKEDVENAIQEVENKIETITRNAVGSTYDKVSFVHDTLVDLISYDQTSRVNNSNIYGALVEETCVCEGYAEAFKVILDRLDIPCVIVYGEGVDGSGRTESHAWNYVKMEDGNWYAVDATWDDPIIIGSGGVLGVNKHKYFLNGSNNFSSTHIESGDVSNTGQNFKYPEISINDYK